MNLPRAAAWARPSNVTRNTSSARQKTVSQPASPESVGGRGKARQGPRLCSRLRRESHST